MANEYDIGDLVQITGTFTNSAGAAVDPDVVTVKYKDPGGTIATDASPTKSATGIYYIDVELDEAGTWFYKFAGTTAGGALQGAEETHFLVTASQFST